MIQNNRIHDALIRNGWVLGESYTKWTSYKRKGRKGRLFVRNSDCDSIMLMGSYAKLADIVPASKIADDGPYWNASDAAKILTILTLGSI